MGAVRRKQCRLRWPVTRFSAGFLRAHKCVDKGGIRVANSQFVNNHLFQVIDGFQMRRNSRRGKDRPGMVKRREAMLTQTVQEEKAGLKPGIQEEVI